MYVSRLEVDGIRGFHGGRRADLAFGGADGRNPAGWTVLAGRNGSGKSTLLQALALAVGAPGGVPGRGAVDVQEWPADRGSGGRIRAVLLANESDTELLMDDQPRRDVEDVLSGASVVEATCVWPPGRKRLRWERRVRALEGPAAGRFFAIDDDLWDATIADAFPHVGYGPHRRLSTMWRGIRSGPRDRFATLFSADAELADGISWLIEHHLRALEGKEDAEHRLRTALALLGDGLLPDGHQVSRVDSDGLWVSRYGREFAIDDLSDGMRTAIAMVTHLLSQFPGFPPPLDGEPPVVPLPAVVLIDEVDAHLHVGWQQRIGSWLTAHFPAVQFIVTTHSPYICQAADPGGLIRLAGPDEDAPPRVVDDEVYRRVVFGSGDDAALSEVFGLESPYSERGEDLRRRLAGLEEQVLAGTATEEEAAEYRELSDTLSSSLMARVDEVAARLARRPG
ncbi:AAA family ATPase [Yinghuangia seranimata]|uniref:AAA family ATPase n=1 Tax=Yinghuangia seranimata TaxID=408067 RepID=UPI00248B1B11|nr:AAA family ATPase [Yinghuangia seranimata]MDI2125173.1 AAA family ATPase [Yinghuangia seranimata]